MPRKMGSVRLIPIYLMNPGVVRSDWHKIPGVGMDTSKTRKTLTSIYLGGKGEPCPSVLQSTIVVIAWTRREACRELPLRKVCGPTNRATRKAGMCGTPWANLVRQGVSNLGRSGRGRQGGFLSAVRNSVLGSGDTKHQHS